MSRVFQVDAFAEAPFTGNPAAVVLLDGPRESGWMQAVAEEMNLSETAFVRPQSDAWALRWFTPAVEVELCGHATLAAAHVLWEAGLASEEHPIRFDTASGRLVASRADGRIELDLPLDPPTPAEPPSILIEALGLIPRGCARGRFDWLVEAESEQDVRALRPDFGLLARLGAPPATVRGVIVTARAATSGYDFVSRFFGPAVGIDEDPVTGSAHCVLGPYWGRRLGKWDLSALQVSKRGGSMRVRVGGERAYLQGRAITVLRGELV